MCGGAGVGRGCAGSGGGSGDRDAALATGQAAANILKLGIAKKFSLEAEVRELGTLTAFIGLEKGEVDIQPEVWRPNFDELAANS